MMAGDLPEITLTDPNNRDTAPTTPFSPIKDASGSEVNGAARGTSGRPVTPTARANPSTSYLYVAILAHAFVPDDKSRGRDVDYGDR